MKIQKPPRPPARACIPAPVTSEAAGRGLWTRLCGSRCPEHPVVPHKPPCPALPIPLSGIYKHFPQINICIDYSLCASRVSLVIQPGRVSSQRLLQLHTKKSTEGERDPDLAGLTAASHGDGWRGRKKENGEVGRRNEGTREPRRESKSRKTKSPLENWCRGMLAAWRNFQPCARRSARRCGGLNALGAKSDSQFWYLLRKSIGGIPWLADRKGRKQQQRYKTIPSSCLPGNAAHPGWLEQLPALL